MKISEKDVARIWQQGGYRWFRDDAGNDIEVICGGRPASRPGCDFQDAVIQVNGCRSYGDVEIHLTSDLWKKHGHNRNPAYNNVILHVALWEQGGLPAVITGGRNIPTVILNSAPVQVDVISAGGCPYISASDGLSEMLTSCGMARLTARSREFAGLLCRENPQQVLYRGICRALGYSRNKAPMEKLSELLPLSIWEQYGNSGETGKLALVIGMAGLLPSQRGGRRIADAESELLEREWNALGNGIETMQEQEWRLAYIRPANSPLRRLAALCSLLGKLGTRWLEIFYDIVKGTDIGRDGKSIEDRLIVRETDYWSCHYDFATEMKRPASILGRGRAREISVNVILPFYLAYAVEAKDYALTDKITSIYAKYPALPQNEITAFMERQLGLQRYKEIRGCRQQGLLHIFHRYCRTRECEKCPVFMRRKPGWG